MSTVEAKPVQPYPAESAESWTKLRKCVAKNDLDGAQAALTKMELSPKLAKLFAIAIDEEVELAAIEAAGVGQREKYDAANVQLRGLHQFHPQTIEAAAEWSAKVSALQGEAQTAGRLADAGEDAKINRNFLHLWLAPLWGESEPEAKGVLGSLRPPAKTQQIASSLAVDLWKLSSWRQLDRQNAPPRKRTFRSFVPAAAQAPQRT